MRVILRDKNFIIILIVVLMFLLFSVLLNFITIAPESTGLARQRQITHWQYFPGFYDLGDIFFDEDGDTLWISSLSGVHQYSRSQKRIIKTYTGAEGLPGTATAVFKLKNKLYIGTQEGLAVLDLTADTFQYLFDSTQAGVNNNIDNFKFQDGKLWMSTFGGLRSLDLAAQRWSNYSSYPDSDFVLTVNKIYLIERRNPGSIIWKIGQVNQDAQIDFQLKNYEWMYIDGNDKYLAAIADPKDYSRNSVLYYKDLSQERWQEIKLPLQGESLRYRKLALDNTSRIFFTYLNNKEEKLLAVYDLQNKTFYQYSLGKIGDVGAIKGSLYPYSLKNRDEVWFASYPFGYIDLKSRAVHFALNLQKPVQFQRIITVNQGKLLINSDLGAGLLDPKNKVFTKITEKEAEDAEWIGDIIWLNLSDIGPGAKFRLGRYDLKNKILKVKTLKNSFTFIKYQKPLIQNEDSVYIMTEKKIALFNFKTDKTKILLKNDPSSFWESKALYTRRYGILVHTSEGIKSFDPNSGTYKVLFNPSFTSIFTLLKDNQLFTLSDVGDIYYLDQANNIFLPLFRFKNNTSSSVKPRSFSIFKKNIVVKTVKPLSKFEPGASHYGPEASYSFFRNQASFIDFQGRIVKEVGTAQGMMAVDFDQNILSDNQCLWFSGKYREGIWAYCE